MVDFNKKLKQDARGSSRSKPQPQPKPKLKPNEDEQDAAAFIVCLKVTGQIHEYGPLAGPYATYDDATEYTPSEYPAPNRVVIVEVDPKAETREERAYWSHATTAWIRIFPCPACGSSHTDVCNMLGHTYPVDKADAAEKRGRRKQQTKPDVFAGITTLSDLKRAAGTTEKGEHKPLPWAYLVNLADVTYTARLRLLEEASVRLIQIQQEAKELELERDGEDVKDTRTGRKRHTPGVKDRVLELLLDLDIPGGVKIQDYTVVPQWGSRETVSPELLLSEGVDPEIIRRCTRTTEFVSVRVTQDRASKREAE